MKEKFINQIPSFNLDDLSDIRDAINQEIKSRKSQNIAVCFWAKINPGNARAGAKAWAKKIDGLDTSKPNGYGLLGDFWKNTGQRKSDVSLFEGALPEGTFLVLCGRGGSWKNSTEIYVLAKIKTGAKISLNSGYQILEAENLELIADSDTKICQEDVSAYPELAKFVGRPLAMIALALKKSGF